MKSNKETYLKNSIMLTHSEHIVMEWSHNIPVLAGHSSAGHNGWVSGNTVRHHQSAWGHSGPYDSGSTGGMVSSHGSKAGL